MDPGELLVYIVVFGYSPSFLCTPSFESKLVCGSSSINPPPGGPPRRGVGLSSTTGCVGVIGFPSSIESSVCADIVFLVKATGRFRSVTYLCTLFLSGIFPCLLWTASTDFGTGGIRRGLCIASLLPTVGIFMCGRCFSGRYDQPAHCERPA